MCVHDFEMFEKNYVLTTFLIGGHAMNYLLKFKNNDQNIQKLQFKPGQLIQF